MKLKKWKKESNSTCFELLPDPPTLPRLEMTIMTHTETLIIVIISIGSNTIRIKFEKTTVKTTGNLSQLPALEIPQLPEQFRPSTNRGSGDFEVTYVDSDLRITRGDRNELRVFVVA